MLLRAMAVVAIAAVLLGGLAGPTFAAVRQSDPGPSEPIDHSRRRAVCEVPDPASRAPLTDGTDGDAGATAESGPIPDPALFALEADLDRLVRALAACLSTGQHATVAELATGRYLGLLAGTGDILSADTYVALAQDLPILPFAIRSMSEIRRDGPTSASADVVYVVANQLVHGRWTFVRMSADGNTDGNEVRTSDATDPGARASSSPDDGRWRIDDETPLPVAAPPGATRIDVELDEYEIALGQGQVARADGGLVLSAGNDGEREHEVLVLRLEDGAELGALLRQPGPRLPEGFVFAGQVTVPPGGQADLILVDLEPGRYAVVSLLPDEDGVPGLARGMEAELQIG